MVKSVTGIFSYPSAKYKPVATLKPGDLTVLQSRVQVSGWLHVIQFRTGHEGWVQASRLTIKYSRHPAPRLDLHSEDLGTDDPPVLSITNNSAKTFFLHLTSYAEISIPPHTTRSTVVVAGIYDYNASAPSVFPVFGKKAFVNGGRYTWTVYISSGLGTVHKAPNQDDLAAFNALRQEVDRESAEARIEKAQIEADRSVIAQKRSQWHADSDEIGRQRAVLDRMDGAAVDAFNRLVDIVNQELAEIREAQERLNAEIDAYNAKIEALNADQTRLDGLSSKINRGR